jgi:putative hydrolase of the HAD superfamily
VEAVLEAMGVRREFDAVFGIEALGFHPKPAIHAYRRLLIERRLDPRRCIMVEDTAVNLRTARRLGMRTVLVSRSPRTPAYVDVKIASILDLRRVAGRCVG